MYSHDSPVKAVARPLSGPFGRGGSLFRRFASNELFRKRASAFRPTCTFGFHRIYLLYLYGVCDRLTEYSMAMKLFVRLALFAAVLGAAADALAQREMTREEYIATYAPLAIQQQKEYGIPASIKIAQGIIESRYGNSDLSRRSNNHFGIKCKNNWIGDTVRYDDDALQECFRRYGSIEDSYRDHSEFLKNSPRYEKLFRLDPKDYKGWAYGLKECGYATAPHYAASLIKCIEDYELYLLDDGEYPAYLAGVEAVPMVPSMSGMVDAYYPQEPIDIDNYAVAVHSVGGRGIFAREGVRYVVARSGDSYADIAQALGIPERRLKRFNRKHLPAGRPAAGDEVYIDRPRKS